MFEYHGWISISETTCEAEDNPELLESLITQIARVVRQLQDDFSKVELFTKNGSHYLRLDGDRDHTQYWVLQLFEKVGELAKGSYGLLYVRDDEDLEYANEFQVWRMARGRVSREKDPFLSPCIPVLES
jgi:hypothetical protein